MLLVLTTLAIIVFTTIVVRRLLGLHRGRWTATAVAVIIGQAATIGILEAVTGNVLHLPWTWVPAGVALVVVLSMVTLALIELAMRPRDRPRPLRLPRPVTAIRGHVARSVRSVQISTIAIREGLLSGSGDDAEVTGSRLGRSLAGTFEQAGGLFVKLGQAMASQPQLVTPAVAAELTRL